MLDVVGSGCGGAVLWGVSTMKVSVQLQDGAPTTATNHIQQNQNNTPNAVTGPLLS